MQSLTTEQVDAIAKRGLSRFEKNGFTYRTLRDTDTVLHNWLGHKWTAHLERIAMERKKEEIEKKARALAEKAERGCRIRRRCALAHLFGG